MKKIILSVFVLLTASIAKSQMPVVKNFKDTIFKNTKRKDAVFIYDFNKFSPDVIYQLRSIKRKGRYDTVVMKQVQKVWYDKRVTAHVMINPYLYDVVINARQVNDESIQDTAAMKLFASHITTILNNAAVLDSSKQITQIENQPLATSIGTGEIKAAVQKNEAIILPKAVDNFLQSFSTTLDISNTDVSEKEGYNILTTQNKNIVDNIQEKIAEEKQKLADYQQAKDNYHQCITNFYDTLSRLQGYYDICEYAVSLCLIDNQTNKEIIKNIDNYIVKETQDSIAKFIKDLPFYMRYYKTQSDKAYQDVNDFYVSLKNRFQKFTYFKTPDFSYDSTIKVKADTLYARFNKSSPEIFAKGFCLMIEFLMTDASFDHAAPTVLTQKDSLIYCIEVKPSERFLPLIQKYNLNTSKAIKFDYPIPVKGNFKVNFSLGVSFMFGKLKGKEYRFDSSLERLGTDESPVKIIENKNPNSFLPSIAAYTHGYFKTGGWLTPGFTIGVSTNPTDFTDATYFVGLSVICGHENRFIVTGGRAAKSVNVLKSRYDLNSTYTRSDFLNMQETDLVQKAFKSGWFFGVSYNLSASR